MSDLPATCPACGSGPRVDGLNRYGWYRYECDRDYSPSFGEWRMETRGCYRRRVEALEKRLEAAVQRIMDEDDPDAPGKPWLVENVLDILRGEAKMNDLTPKTLVHIEPYSEAWWRAVMPPGSPAINFGESVPVWSEMAVRDIVVRALSAMQSQVEALEKRLEASHRTLREIRATAANPIPELPHTMLSIIVKTCNDALAEEKSDDNP